MAPTLPTELIKLILEFVYEDVRALDRLGPAAPPTHFDGDSNVPYFFAPFFVVSRVFHAIALPISVRHLRNYEWMTTAVIKMPEPLQLAPLGRHVQSLAIQVPEDPLSPIHQLLQCCTQLRALQVWPLPLRIDLLPLTITTLVLGSSYEWTDVDGDRLAQLATALPKLKSLELINVRFHEPFNEVGWRLERLSVVGTSNDSADHILQLLQDSSETLVDLTLRTSVQVQNPLLLVNVLQRVGIPFPSLRRLELGEHDSLVPGSQIISANMLPVLKDLTMPIGDGGAGSLVEISRTLKVVKLLVLSEADVVSSRSPLVADLETFVRSHQDLDLLSVDLVDEQIPDVGWSATLQGLCAERGVHFCTNDPAYGVEGGLWYGPPVKNHQDVSHDERRIFVYVDEYNEECRCSQCDEEGLMSQSWSSGSSSETTGVGSSGVSEVLDFDAEDDEMWARQWSEEKREAMGLVAKLEEKEEEKQASAEVAEQGADGTSTGAEVDNGA